jgi:hypothetical protein
MLLSHKIKRIAMPDDKISIHSLAKDVHIVIVVASTTVGLNLYHITSSSSPWLHV